MSLTKEKATEYLGKLMSIKMNGPFDSGTGICGNLDEDYCGDWTFRSFMWTACREWEHFSGDDIYPVPSHLGLRGAFRRAEEWGCLWDDSTEYGALRWELVDFLIEFWSEKLGDWDYWTEKYDGWSVGK